MKDSVLWLQLPQRNKPDDNSLYSSISDMSQWIERTEKLKAGEKARLYFSLLVEVNSFDIPVHERLIFLGLLHSPVINLVDKLSKKFFGCGLPLDEEKSKYVELVAAFWSELAVGYKIIIDDLSDVNFITSLIRQKDLSDAVSYVMYYLIQQLFYNYLLYTDCSMGVWRDIHQLFQFTSKKNLAAKTAKRQVPEPFTSVPLSVKDQYKKILLFSLANPYHLSTNEMKVLWEKLDGWAKYAHLILDNGKALQKKPPFFIKPYSDLPPFPNHRNTDDSTDNDMVLPDNLYEIVCGLETNKLLKHMSKTEQSSEIAAYFFKRLQSIWLGDNHRNHQRKDLIEPVVIVMGVSSISQFLSQIDISPKILNLDDRENQKIEFTATAYSSYQAFLMDESEMGFRIKLNIESETAILPKIGEVVAIKHSDDRIHTGYLRWIHESREGDIECGIEHLSSMAESVQITKNKQIERHLHDDISEKITTLDSFVIPGSKENHYKPVLFTHTFIEKFYNARTDHLKLTHKTGSIDIKLTKKVGEVLDYSLYLFEKEEIKTFTEQVTKEEKTEKFKAIWVKI